MLAVSQYFLIHDHAAVEYTDSCRYKAYRPTLESRIELLVCGGKYIPGYVCTYICMYAGIEEVTRDGFDIILSC